MNSKGKKRRGVGRLLDGCEIKILRDGTPVDTGKGSIWVRSRYSMERYLYENQARGDHFFQTGDIGRIDEDGFMHIEGREKELIIKKSKKISPKRVENVLMSIDKVTRAFVSGEECEEEELIHAFIESEKIAGQQIRQECRKHLDKTEIPDKITFTSEFPEGATGKIKRGKL